MESFDLKQPWEELPGKYADFAGLLLDGETIIEAEVTCTVPELLKVGTVNFTGTIVSFTITGGSDGDYGVFTIKVTGSMGSKREREVSILVLET